MSDFFEREAIESEDEDINSDDDERSGHRSATPSKKKKSAIISSDEEEEDEEVEDEKYREEMKGFIADDDDEEGESGSDSDGDAHKKKRRKRRKSRSDEDLDEDDMELLQENLGVKIKKQRKRIKIGSDDDDDDEGDNDTMPDNNQRINEFDDGGDGYDSEDVDDFIVGSDGQPIKKDRKKKRKHIFSDSARQNAEDVFGVKFDYDEFANYGDEEYDSDDDEDEDDEYGERTKKVKSRKKKTKTIFEICDPNELEAGYYTGKDRVIRDTDVPERIQLRTTPVTSVEEGSDELDRESDWIFKYGFVDPSVSRQDISEESDRWRSKDGTMGIVRQQIKCTLEFIRQQSHEVPFISNYRKEYVPDLFINDLWHIYQFDELWCKLQSRKENLKKLYKNMLMFQNDKIMSDPEAPLPEGYRMITNTEIDNLNLIETVEELKDRDQYFKLYYGQDIEAMQAFIKKKKKEERETNRLLKKQPKRKTKIITNEDGEEIEVTDNEAQSEEENQDGEESEEFEQETLKQACRKDTYSLCVKYGLYGMSSRFGLTAEQFGANLEDGYQKVDVEQEQSDPLEVAGSYAESSEKFTNPDDVLSAAKFMLATQIARDPLVRKVTRDQFMKRATICVRPTKKGVKEIDETHDCFRFKYLSKKPVTELIDDQWLKLTQAEEQKQLEIIIAEDIYVNNTSTFLDEAKQVFRYDAYSKSVTEWNNLREEIIDIAFKKMLYPMLRKELRLRLTREAKEGLVRSCRKKLYDWIKTSKYMVSFEEEDEDDWDSSHGCRIMGIAYENDIDVASYAVCLHADGEVGEFIKLEHLLKRKKSFNAKEKAEKMQNLDALETFIVNNRPHCIVIGTVDRAALDIQRDLKELVNGLIEKEQFPNIGVFLMDDNLAKVYASSQKAERDFRDYPSNLRQAISIARRMKDPLVEFSQLCGPENEILCLRYHPLQDLLSDEELLEGLSLEFINLTCQVGVDINECIAHPYMKNLVQFIGGLGPRKASYLLRKLESSQRLENRQQLVTLCQMGPKVLINCAGFIKIDTTSLGDSEVYLEVLDGSRIHNEAYEWARKMAVDALEYDEEDGNPATALDEIIQEPDKLAELDLEAFAQELERQGFGKKSKTLQDIRDELHNMYKDKREPYSMPNPEEVFNMVTKETPRTFYVGKLVQAFVSGFTYRRSPEEELNQAAPLKKGDFWQCPFCGLDNFPELTDVWNHLDENDCPGKAVGVKVRLDNGVLGFIPMKNLSDSPVLNPKERVKEGMNIFCRITKIQPERFSVECVCKSSALVDKDNEWRPKKDDFYDFSKEIEDRDKENEKKKQKQRQTYTKRVIHHQNFHNISFNQTLKLMKTMDQGEAVIRPSSKGDDRLTVTWKVTEGIYQHIDIREEGKINSFTRGKSLWIGNDEFEDLDEIIARHINPMAQNAREILSFKYYKDTNGGNKERAKEIIMAEKASQPSKIHYFFSASKELPGKFMLTYLPRNNVRYEFATVTPDGFRFRQQNFDNLNSLMKWFKEHFRDAIPGTPITPGRGTNRTPYMNTPGGGITPGAMSLATGTPFRTTPGGRYGSTNINTPYTPTANTPFMTPYNNTPGHGTTPRPGYGAAIPPYRGTVEKKYN